MDLLFSKSVHFKPKRSFDRTNSCLAKLRLPAACAERFGFKAVIIDGSTCAFLNCSLAPTKSSPIVTVDGPRVICCDGFRPRNGEGWCRREGEKRAALQRYAAADVRWQNRQATPEA